MHGSEPGARVHPFCSELAEKGDFLFVYGSVTEAVLFSEPWTTEDIVGLARVLTSCTNLFQLMPAHLPQPALSLAQLMLEMLPRVPEFTSNPHLQEHLIRAALQFITTHGTLSEADKSVHQDFQSTLLPQVVVPEEIACATLQLLFLCLKSVLQAYKKLGLYCMPQPPGDLTDYDSSLTQSQIAAKLAVLDTRPDSAVKRQHAYLLDHRSFLVEDLVPFIDMMCQSGEWIEALGQANAHLTWCTSRYQADWKHNFGELLCQHVISDAVGYKLEVIFSIEPGQEAFVLAPGGQSSFPLADMMSFRDDMLAMGAKRRVPPGAAKRRKTTDQVMASTDGRGSTRAVFCDRKQAADNAREYIARPSAADPNKVKQLPAKATTAAQTAPARIPAKPLASEAIPEQKSTSDAAAQLIVRTERLREIPWHTRTQKDAQQKIFEEKMKRIEAEATQKAKQEALAKAEAARKAVEELLAEEKQAAHQAAAKKAKKDRRKAKKQQQQEEELLTRQQQQEEELLQRQQQQQGEHHTTCSVAQSPRS
ncbi:hypothetical protein WJX79_010968 [Trebouxia sp. C0005]